MSEDPPKVRLRPRLTPDPSPPLAPADAPAATPPDTPTARSKPRLPAELGSKPPIPGGGTRPPIATPLPAETATPAASATAAGSRAAVPGGSKAPILPADVVPALVDSSPPMEAGMRPRDLAPLADRARRVRQAATAITLAGALAFGAIAYVAYPKLTAQEAAFQEARRLARLYAADEPAPEPPPPLPNPPAPASETPTPHPKPAVPPPAPVETAPAPTSTAPSGPLEIPAVIGVETVRTATGAEGSTSFKEWVASVKIAGLRTGANPRILIGGASFDVGDTVSIELEIRFDGYDADRRVLRFRDATGAVLERRHP